MIKRIQLGLCNEKLDLVSYSLKLVSTKSHEIWYLMRQIKRQKCDKISIYVRIRGIISLKSVSFENETGKIIIAEYILMTKDIEKVNS